MQIHQLESIENLASHKSLQTIQLNFCSRLGTLGDPAPNQRLNSVALSHIGELENLKSLAGTTALKGLTISKCEKMSEPLLIDETNPLEYCYVFKSGNLKKR